MDFRIDEVAPPGSGLVPETLPPSAAAALQQGNKVEAIRLLREETGIELKAAKEVGRGERRTDSLETSQPLAGRSSPFPGRRSLARGLGDRCRFHRLRSVAAPDMN